MGYPVGTTISLRKDGRADSEPRHFAYEVGTRLVFDRIDGRLRLPWKINVLSV